MTDQDYNIYMKLCELLTAIAAGHYLNSKGQYTTQSRNEMSKAVFGILTMIQELTP